MDIHILKFPRKIEVNECYGKIINVLKGRTEKLWVNGNFEVPVLQFSDSLKDALKKALNLGTLQRGFELAAKNLDGERQGLLKLQERDRIETGQRISRLLLFTNDGAERFYRNIESLLKLHFPRVLGCMIDINSETLGGFLFGEGKEVKLVMANHKDTVFSLLMSLVE